LGDNQRFVLVSKPTIEEGGKFAIGAPNQATLPPDFIMRFFKDLGGSGREASRFPAA
jgi:hypothetical protein